MERLDLYDENRKPTGETILRETAKNTPLEKNRFYTIVLVFIQNSKGEFLYQMTSKEKGGYYATTGGHVQSGQTSLQAIVAELYEELGISIGENEVTLFKTYHNERVYVDVYYLKKDININDLVYQKEEVDYTEFFSKEQLLELIEKGLMRTTNISILHEILAKYC